MNPHRDALCRALGLASVLVFVVAGPAAAQFPPPPGQPAAQAGPSPFPPPPGQAAPRGPSPFPSAPGQAAPAGPSPFPPAGGQAGPPGKNPCDAFVGIRQNAEKRADAIQAASTRKASREEVCPLFRTFAAAEERMVKFLEENQQQCGVPAGAIKQARSQHAQTLKIRAQVCAAPPAPPGPRLSDAFGGPPVIPDEPQKSYGIFDTLTGSPLGR